MTTPFIVGIGHVARVGKDTAGEALCRDLGFTRVGFADQLKELAKLIDPIVTSSTVTVNTDVGKGRLSWVVKGLGWEAAKDQYREVRRFLQALGEAGRLTFGEDFWINRALSDAKADRIVVTDVRYLNEAEAIRAMGGLLIRINRPGRVASGHVSETDLLGFEWDEEFDNNGSIQELQQHVVAYVKRHLEARTEPLLNVGKIIREAQQAPLDMDVLLHEAQTKVGV